VVRETKRLEPALRRMRDAGIRLSLFIAPDDAAIHRSRELAVDAIELHTGAYAHAAQNPATLDALRRASALGRTLGLAVHAGHGLTIRNVGPVAAISEIEELNIGHSIVSRAVFIGLEAAVREIMGAMRAARQAVPG
jgi:pyridoxine 5-phosphate synthase